MFWVKYDDLKPYLSTQNIFVSDANNLPTCTYADYFTLGLYNGDIYKTRNLRNRSMKQLYPNPDDLAHAQDSIQKQLDTFEDKFWVPTLEQLAAEREKREALEAGLAADQDSTALATAAEEPKKTGVPAAEKRRKLARQR